QVVEVPVFTTLTATPGFISPAQSPGIQDSLALNTTVIKERGTLNWTITIRDSTNTVVRVLSGTGGTGGPHTSVSIAASWDGKINAVNPVAGPFSVAPDGDYTIVSTFTDQYTNTASSNTVTVVVDDVNPTATTLNNSNVLIAPGVSGVSVPGT